MDFDVAVLGLGAMGSATCAHLAARGVRVVGLERFTAGHDLGSSAGRSRIIRRAYFEHPSYVPLLDRSYDLWRDLEAQARIELLDLFGVLVVGAADSEIVRGVDRSARHYGIAVERFDTDMLRERYPALRIRDGETGILERDAGIVFPERGIAAHLAVACENGATVRDQARVVAIANGEAKVTLVLDTGEQIRCERLVVCAGPWTNALLAELALPLRVERNVQFWFQAERGTCTPRDLPAFLLDRDGWTVPVYGMPDLGDGVKFAFHGGGTATEPDRLQRTVDDLEIANARDVLEQWIPQAAGASLGTKACMYTLTPDGNFAIGVHPYDSRIAIACGFSGHGYKFAPVIGEIAADLAMDRKPVFDLGFLALDRFF
jgi:sarcosine oxidase